MTKTELEDYLALELEDKTFEEVLEDYDLAPHEVFYLLYRNGLIDDEILEAKFNAY